jgi:hypothetical protein
MTKMDPALAAVLYEAWRLSPVYTPSDVIAFPTWSQLHPPERAAWEQVAKVAVEFITEERVS